MTFDELTEKLSLASAGDSELDREIARIATEHPRHLVNYYTSSIDTALKLVPDGCNWSIRYYKDKRSYGACVGDDSLFHGKTAALALCIAAMFAWYRAQKQRELTSMTVDQAIALVEMAAAGRTKYEGAPSRADEVLVAEVKRLRKCVTSMEDLLHDARENLDDRGECSQRIEQYLNQHRG